MSIEHSANSEQPCLAQNMGHIKLWRAQRVISALSLSLKENKIYWFSLIGPLILIFCTVLLWWISLPHVNINDITNYGLVSVLPISFFVALSILTTSFFLVLHAKRIHVLLAILHIVVLIFIIHGTPTFLYETPRYAWTYKHIGVTEYIQRHGEITEYIQRHRNVNPNISIYFNWPGFFALGALITKIAGFESALNFASWAPVFFNFINIGALLLIFKAFTNNQRLIWLGIWLFYITNWVGQDYYAPQALSYFFHLVVIGVCLNWFNSVSVSSEQIHRRWLVFTPLDRLVYHIVHHAYRDDNLGFQTQPWKRVGLMIIIILSFSVIASSHQLTPFMTIACISMLVAFQRCRARSLPILMAVIAVAWIVYVSVAYTQVQLPVILGSMGRLGNNFSTSISDLSKSDPGRAFVAMTSRILSVSVWTLALLGCIRRLHRGYWDLSCLLLAVIPFLMLAAQSYGGEMLLRIYLFSLPFMIWLAAVSFHPDQSVGISWKETTVTALISGVLMACFLITYYGNERMNNFTRNELNAVEYINSVEQPNSLLIMESFNAPIPFQNYENYNPIFLTDMEEFKKNNLGNPDVAVIAEIMKKHQNSYLLITQSQREYINLYNVIPESSLDDLERSIRQSKLFKVVFSNNDAQVFVLADAEKGELK